MYYLLAWFNRLKLNKIKAAKSCNCAAFVL